MRLLWLASLALACALCASAAHAAGAGSVRWAVSGGGTGDDDLDGVGTDARGRIVISGGVEGANAGSSDIVATGCGTFSGTARIGDFTLTTTGLRGAYVAKVSPAGQVAWVASSTDSGFATLGELSLGPNSVNVLGRFAGTAHFGPFTLTSAGATDYFLAQLKR